MHYNPAYTPAQARIEEVTVESCVTVPKEVVYAKIASIAKEYGVSESVMDYVVKNESTYDNCAIGDTHLTDPNGEPHISLGAVQINRYYNPQITESDALDIDFSLRFLAQGLKDGKCSHWTTCRMYLSKK